MPISFLLAINLHWRSNLKQARKSDLIKIASRRAVGWSRQGLITKKKIARSSLRVVRKQCGLNVSWQTIGILIRPFVYRPHLTDLTLLNRTTTNSSFAKNIVGFYYYNYCLLRIHPLLSANVAFLWLPNIYTYIQVLLLLPQQISALHLWLASYT